jgi:hypothetical protein
MQPCCAGLGQLQGGSSPGVLLILTQIWGVSCPLLRPGHLDSLVPEQSELPPLSPLKPLLH